MASKKSSDAGKGNGRIRFVLFEADGVDGNLSDIAHAISSALRSQGGGQKALPSAGRRQLEASDTIDVLPEEVDDDQSEDAPQPEPRVASASRKRAVRKVEVLQDVDLNSGAVPLATFLEEKKPKNRAERYLAIAYWFKHHRDTPTVTVEHIYTGYRKMGWTIDIPDMTQVFRELKRAAKGATAKGAFTINYLGEDAVNKLGNGTA